MRPTRHVAVDKPRCFSFKENAMRFVCGIAILGLSFGLLALAAAQEPKDRPTDKEAKKAADKEDKANSPATKSFVDALMAFDKNKNGKLEKSELIDPRLRQMFDRADTNKDGVVTKEELAALAERMREENGRRAGFGPPGGAGGPPGGPPGQFGPRGFGPPAPGQIVPPFLQERLKLTAEQKKQLEALQKEIDSKLDKILTEEQRKQLKEMRRGFGPRGPGGPPPGDGPSRPPR
jgi:Spy/CpxP family protein refolding chaperone